MPVIKPFIDLLEKAGKMHKLKNDDYANEQNKYFNFEVQADLIKMFEKTDPHHQAFASLVGLKIARLAQLLEKGRNVNNEGIEDTFLDFFVYVGLWSAWYEEHEKKQVGLEQLDTERVQVFDKADEPVKVQGMKFETNFPDICTNCTRGTTSERVKHALVMHSAIFNRQSSTLKYPTGLTILLSPQQAWDVNNDA